MSEHTFGLVGCGMIARFHALAIGAMENGRLVGAAENGREEVMKYVRAFEHLGPP